ncbi:MAG: TerB family tellurite resistance protein [Myxococcales bacterium]|nr:TerB family tellurite resistance protein [Myxococcales bacterium]
MNFLKGTALLPTADELGPLTEDQNLAILEALFVTVLADGKIEPSEVKTFTASALSYPWNWGQGPEILREKLASVATRLKGVGRDNMQAHLSGLGQRLPSGSLRDKVFAGMFALMVADGKLDREEKAAALAIAGELEIPPSRAMELVQQVTAARAAVSKK